MEKNTVMFKRSASRTQRSKGVVRTKQILQILLLLGICFWLVYQVKYSHDKKKVILDEKDSKIFHREQDDNIGLKFGRKDLHTRVYEKQQKADEEDKVEDEDEENKLEEDEHEEVEESNVGGVQPFQDDVKEADSEEDDVKKAHEEVELEEDEREEEEEEARNDEPENHEKTHEIEVEEEEEGLKELEDREQERPQVEGDDHEEEFIDEEKEKEEETDEKEHEGNSEEVKNKQVEDEDQDRNEISHGVHEAREEHYKGDDASSAVAHGTESDTLTKSSIPINESGTAEIIEKNSGSESLNGSEDHDGATDVEIIKSVDANITELANTSLTDETEMGNATSVNSNTTLSETEEAVMYQTSDPELIELSKNHSEDTSFVGPDSSLRLSSNTTGSSKTNTQDEDPGGHNEAGGVETD